MKNIDANISKEKFNFVNSGEMIHDVKFDTKPVSYMRDAFRRFAKNKASVVAAIIIALMFLYAILVPIFSPFSVAFRDSRYITTLPKSKLFTAMGANFWDGCSNMDNTQTIFEMYYGINQETGQQAVKNGKYTSYTVTQVMDGGTERISERYKFRLDSYYKIGCVYVNLTVEEYNALQDYQDKTGNRVLYPVVANSERMTTVLDKLALGSSAQYQNDDGYFWYKIDPDSLVKVGTSYQPRALKDANGNFINNYCAYSGLDSNGNPWDGYYSKLRMDDETAAGEPLYDYAVRNQGGYQVRLNYYEYFKYIHANDGIGEPMFLFGTNGVGQDIFTCLASGAQFSFLLAIFVAVINMLVGAIYGAIEGYFGGATDMLMERVSDILGGIPMMIVIVIVRLHLREAGASPSVLPIMSVFLAFFATGWIGTAGTVRMQFYRFKNQEYVLAARTLGAGNARIMLKHIFPNSLGTIVTSSVLVIPGVIFSESSLSYLGIIDMSSSNLTSVGSMLANSQAYMTSFPHVMLFPALFISLLMLSFNLFGNGLRDAFNPSLRGTEG